MDPACCDSAEAPAALVVQVCFPGARAAVLDNLNRQREEGRLCDLSIQVQGRVFRAHRCVLAASSPYFHDQVLLKDVAAVALPSVLDPLAFESVLRAAYTGRLSVVRDEVVHYVTVASFLQMWHIVDKCTEILKKPRPPPPGPAPRQPSPSSTDSPERGGRRRDRRTHALPPLATWRRPQQPARWGRHRASPAPPDPADSQLDGPPSYQYGCGEAWAAPEGAGPSGGGGEAVKQRARGEAGGGGYPGPSGLASARFQWQAGSWTQQDLAAQDTAGAPSWKEEEEEEEDEEEDVFECFSFEADGPEPPWSPRGVQGGCGGVQGGSGGTQGGCGGVQGGGAVEGLWAALGGSKGVLEGPRGAVEGFKGVLEGLRGAVGPREFLEGTKVFLEGTRGAVEGFKGAVEGFKEAVGPTGFLEGPRGFLEGTRGGVGGPRGVLEAPQRAVGLLPPAASPPPHPAPRRPRRPPRPGRRRRPPPGKLHRCHCGKAYALKSMRDRHVKMAHLNLRPFGCPVCSKSFKMKHHLTKHLRTHGGLRPYECSLCGKKVVWRDSFLRHQARCQRLAGAAKATAAPPPQDGYGYGFPQGGAFPPAGQVKVEEVDFHREMGGLLDSVSGMVEDSHSLDAGGHVFKEEASESFGGS
ncbi:unnamed protein product [Menidia menidia]|uniref:(Atlantic silverside) hypothetical protein n=1 Tax=Menidia menidia TaxID=238744 RepID=A0A8S4B9I5_9TELE|nr:unnamed protein product [Menidia menidia]